MAKSTNKGEKKIEKVMHEFKEGTLNMGKSDKKVTKRKQAVAIALSEAREAGADIPQKPAKKTTAKKAGSPKKGPATATKKAGAKSSESKSTGKSSKKS